MKNKKLIIWLLVIAAIFVIIYFVNKNKPVKDVFNLDKSSDNSLFNSSPILSSKRRTASGNLIYKRG